MVGCTRDELAIYESIFENSFVFVFLFVCIFVYTPILRLPNIKWKSKVHFLLHFPSFYDSYFEIAIASTPVCYFTSSVLCEEPDKIVIESIFICISDALHKNLSIIFGGGSILWGMSAFGSDNSPWCIYCIFQIELKSPGFTVGCCLPLNYELYFPTYLVNE